MCTNFTTLMKQLVIYFHGLQVSLIFIFLTSFMRWVNKIKRSIYLLNGLDILYLKLSMNIRKKEKRKLFLPPLPHISPLNISFYYV